MNLAHLARLYIMITVNSGIDAAGVTIGDLVLKGVRWQVVHQRFDLLFF